MGQLLDTLVNYIQGNKKIRILGFALPGTIFLVIFFIIPLVLLFWLSFWKMTRLHFEPAFTLENYIMFFSYPQAIPVLLNTIRIAATVTVISFILGYPFAHELTFKVAEKRQTILTLILVFPFFIGVLCRTYAWRILLGSEGALNSFLMFIGVIKEPLQILLFSEFALIIVLIYNCLLFMVFPIYFSLQRVDKRLFEASSDLGGSSLRTFSKITLPLSMPGVMAGTIFTFITACTAYVEPRLIGGPEGFMFANLIGLEFNTSYQWPLGAAMGTIMLILVLIICGLFIKLVGLEKIFRV